MRRKDGALAAYLPAARLTAPGGAGARVAQSGVQEAVLEAGHAWTMRPSSMTYARSARPRAIDKFYSTSSRPLVAHLLTIRGASPSDGSSLRTRRAFWGARDDRDRLGFPAREVPERS